MTVFDISGADFSYSATSLLSRQCKVRCQGTCSKIFKFTLLTTYLVYVA